MGGAGGSPVLSPHDLERDEPPGATTVFGLRAGIIVLALATRLLLAMAPVEWLDTRFVPDDTYYILAIARSLAEGVGPSADGATLTNGFQPLIVFLLAPVVFLLGDGDATLRVLWLGLALVDVGNVVLAGMLAQRLGGRRAGDLAALIWATSPLALKIALGGMETSLAIFCSLALVELWCRARAGRGWLPWVGVGVMCTLTLLARIDTGALIGMLGLVELVRGSRRGVLLAAATSLLAISPWWGWSWMRLGSPFPESGAAVSQLAYVYQGADAHWIAARWAVGMLLFGPSVELGPLRVWVLVPVVGAVVGIVLVAVLAWAAARLAREWGGADVPVAVLLVYGALLPVLYVVFVPAVWFFARYLSPSILVLTLAISVLVSRSGRRAVVLTGVAMPLTGLGTFALQYGPSFRMQDVAAIEATTGYLTGMQEAMAQVPEGAVVGSMQSGALSWVAPEGVRVVNLDGVVDRAAYEGLADRRLDRVLRARGVTHFIDWELQRDLLLEHSAEGLTLEPVWRWDRLMCSRHQLTVWRVAKLP